MSRAPLDPLSEFVDEQRRIKPDWYTWLSENSLEATIVAKLPLASRVAAGARCFVTDATATTFHSVVVGGGSNKVPVVSDGTDWLIG